jgi:hypothetical protein
MSPLRAMVSRGHIAFRNRNPVPHSRFFQSACVNRPSIVRLAARRQGRANDGLHLDRARSATAWLLRLHAGESSGRRLFGFSQNRPHVASSAISGLGFRLHPTQRRTQNTRLKLFAGANKRRTPVMAKSPCSECPQVRGKRSMGDLTNGSQREKGRTARPTRPVLRECEPT